MANTISAFIIIGALMIACAVLGEQVVRSIDIDEEEEEDD